MCGCPVNKSTSPAPATVTGTNTVRWLVIGCAAGALLFIVAVALLIYIDREQPFTPIVESVIYEDDMLTLPSSIANHKTIASFQPRTTGELVRVSLWIEQPYPHEVDDPGKLRIMPECELVVVRNSDGQRGIVVAQTKSVWMSEISPYGLSIELTFIPEDTETYVVEFQGPKDRFRKYTVRVGQQGL